jgi:hypothetical protein
MTHQSPIKADTVADELAAMDAEQVERQALIAFYEIDCMPTKARCLKLGAPLDYMDLRTLEALRAAAEKLAA